MFILNIILKEFVTEIAAPSSAIGDDAFLRP
jgi:hypothetical protein